MTDALEVDLYDSRLIYSFDGRILEIFGKISVIGGQIDAGRIHVRQLSMKVSEPDKKGAREVYFVGPTGERKYIRADEETWSLLQPLLEALRAAGAKVEP